MCLQVLCGPLKLGKTDVIKKTLDPEWNASFSHRLLAPLSKALALADKVTLTSLPNATWTFLFTLPRHSSSSCACINNHPQPVPRPVCTSTPTTPAPPSPTYPIQSHTRTNPPVHPPTLKQYHPLPEIRVITADVPHVRPRQILKERPAWDGAPSHLRDDRAKPPGLIVARIGVRAAKDGRMPEPYGHAAHRHRGAGAYACGAGRTLNLNHIPTRSPQRALRESL